MTDRWREHFETLGDELHNDPALGECSGRPCDPATRAVLQQAMQDYVDAVRKRGGILFGLLSMAETPCLELPGTFHWELITGIEDGLTPAQVTAVKHGLELLKTALDEKYPST